MRGSSNTSWWQRLHLMTRGARLGGDRACSMVRKRRRRGRLCMRHPWKRRMRLSTTHVSCRTSMSEEVAAIALNPE